MTNKYWLYVFLACSAITAILTISRYISQKDKFNQSSTFRHVFINETDDHRFDESIQISILAAHHRTQIQNAVVITDRFSGDVTEIDLEKTATDLFKKLELGKHTNGRAILYLYSPKAKSLKIEVGYALESSMPDVKVHGFEMAAKSFIFSDRFQDFWAELINTINIEIQESTVANKNKNTDFDFSKFRFSSGGAGVLSKDFEASKENFLIEFKKIENVGDPKFLAHATIELSLNNYLQSLKDGIGDEALPFLSDESRLFRRLTPMTNYQLYRNWKMYSKAGIQKIIELDKLAFVFFKPNHPVLPIILVKTEGLWKIQEPLAWALFQRFEDSNRVFLKYPIITQSETLNSYLAINLGDPLYREPAVDLEMLTKPDLDNKSKSLAKIQLYYFKYYWLEKAQKELEASGANMTKSELNLAADIYNNLGQFSKFLITYEQLAKLDNKNKKTQKNLEFYRKHYKFNGSDWQLKF